jgi:hypothetical protein
VSAAPDYQPGWPAGTEPDLAALLAAAGTAVAGLAGGADLSQMADREAAAVMGALTTLVGRLDGLRVQVAREVRDRGICGLRGSRSLADWLNADARLADDAWKLGRLAGMTPELPKITALLASGTICLSQAATACWQISKLPRVPVPPDTAERPDPGETSDPEGPVDEDAWAGLWRAGDVHAAADELFAQVLPGLDSDQLRQLGAHLREAADSQEHAGDDQDDYARRGLRISRSLGGAGEISGRLHAEAAEQVIAAFEQLGAKTGPDDKRTKAQRWADALARLTATTPDLRPGPAAQAPAGSPDPSAGQAGCGDEDDDDQASDADPRTGHDHHGHEAGPTAAHSHDAAAPEADKSGHEHGTHAPGGPTAAPEADKSGHEHGTHAPGPPAGVLAAGVPAAYRRPRVIVTVPLSTLLGQPLSPGATLGPGRPLTAEAARRLTCDAEIIRLITSPDPPDITATSNGTATTQLTQLLAAAIAQLPPPLATPSAVLDIGRKSPGWTPRQRDALYAQYGGRCSAPRCTGPIDVIHHIIHWLYGGKTRTINGAPFCDYHHWLVHEGGWRARKLPDGTITLHPPPPGWRPGTIYRHGKPLTE